MRNLGRLAVICILAFSVLLIVPASLKQSSAPRFSNRSLKTYGLDSYGQGGSDSLHLERRNPWAYSKFLTCGSGSRRRARSRTKERTKPESR